MEGESTVRRHLGKYSGIGSVRCQSHILLTAAVSDYIIVKVNNTFPDLP